MDGWIVPESQSTSRCLLNGQIAGVIKKRDSSLTGTLHRFSIYFPLSVMHLEEKVTFLHHLGTIHWLGCGRWSGYPDMPGCKAVGKNGSISWFPVREDLATGFVLLSVLAKLAVNQ